MANTPTIEIESIADNYMNVKFKLVAGVTYLCFLSLYEDVYQALGNQIQPKTFDSSRLTGFSNLDPDTTYYVFAVDKDALEQGLPFDYAYISATTLDRYTYMRGRARISVINSTTITGNAVIENRLNTTIMGNARIENTENTTITGNARISILSNTTITGNAMIKTYNSHKLPEDWNYSGTPEPETWNSANKDPVGWSVVEKEGENWSEIGKEDTEWAKVDNPEPLEWGYPLEGEE